MPVSGFPVLNLYVPPCSNSVEPDKSSVSCYGVACQPGSVCLELVCSKRVFMVSQYWAVAHFISFLELHIFVSTLFPYSRVPLYTPYCVYDCEWASCLAMWNLLCGYVPIVLLSCACYESPSSALSHQHEHLDSSTAICLACIM